MTVDDNTGTPTGPSDDDAQPVEPVAAEPVEVAPVEVAPVAPVAAEPVFEEPTPEQFASEDDDADDSDDDSENDDDGLEVAVAAGGVLVGAGAVARGSRPAGAAGAATLRTTEAKPARGPFGRLKARIARIATFYRQVVAELRKVIWPTRKELITYTSVVLVFVFVMVTIVGVFDFAFGQAVINVFGA